MRSPSSSTSSTYVPGTRYPTRGVSPGAVAAARSWRFTDPNRFRNIDRRVAYRSYPRQHYRLNYRNGYRGMGWYYGPPNYTYYYESPYVTYYPSRSLIPSTLLSLVIGGDAGYRNSLDYEVQTALADLGYYQGPLDGDIGPMSRLAIANFQADNGLEPTGIIDENLLYYLGIQ